MAFRILAVLAAVALSTTAFANTTTTKKTTTTTTTQSAPKQTAKPAAQAAPATRPVETYSVSSTMSKDMNVGLLAGLSFLDNGGGTKFTAGLEWTYNIMPEFGLGLEFQMPFVGSGVTVWSGLAQFWYNFSGSAQGLHLGAKAGMMSASTSVTVLGTTVSASSTDFAYGPALGYDYWMNSEWTIGGQADYLINSASGGSKMFQVFATAKYWF